jgi:hypothetical protein
MARSIQEEPMDDDDRSREAGTVFELAEAPPGTVLCSVTAEPAEIEGRRALRVQLSDSVARDGEPGVDYVDMPTFAILPIELVAGTVEVDVLSRLAPEAPGYARGFAGIAFHVADGGERFEAVYLRPLNGLGQNPPAPRDARAVQYFSYPDWKYQRLRDEFPDGRYEAGADIAPDEWARLRIEIDGDRVEAVVDGISVLVVDAKPSRATGALGLWVDIGTEAYFSRLVVTPQ